MLWEADPRSVPRGNLAAYCVPSCQRWLPPLDCVPTCQRWPPPLHCVRCPGVAHWPAGPRPSQRWSGVRRRRSEVHSTLTHTGEKEGRRRRGAEEGEETEGTGQIHRTEEQRGSEKGGGETSSTTSGAVATVSSRVYHVSNDRPWIACCSLTLH